MQTYINFLDKHKYKIIIFTTLVVALLSISLKNLAFEGSYRIWFDKDSSIIKNYDDFRDTFSGDDTFIVAFKDGNGIFNKKAVDVILDLTHRFKQLNGVRKVDSLSNYQYISSEDDDIMIEDFLYGDDNLVQKRTIALKDELILNQLISNDAKTTMIAISLNSTIGGDEDINIYLFDKLQDILKSYSQETGYKFYITGSPAITASLVSIAQDDAKILMPLAVLMVIVSLFLIFRTMLGVLIPSVVVVFTFLSVLSMQMILGYKLNNFTVNIPSFITAIAIADAMHLYLAWIYYKLQNNTTKTALYYALKSNIKPMALTSFTTAIGFASLGISHIEPISTLGIAITSGAIIAFLLSLTLVPAIILTLKDTYKIKPVKMINLIHTDGYGAFIKRNNKKIIFIFVLVMFVISLGLIHLKVDSNSIKYFSKDTVVRGGADFVQENLTGSMRYEIILDSIKKEGVKNPIFLKEIVKFENVLKENFPTVRFTTSLKDIIKRMQKVINPQAQTPIPTDNKLVAQYLLLYSMSLPQGMEINDKIDTSERYLRLTINTDIQDTSKDLEMISWIKDYWSKNTNYKADVQGQTAIFAYMQSSVISTLISSISITFLVVFVVMFFVLKDFKLLLLFLLPNIAPIIFVGGVMGYLDISVDIGVAISVAVIFGIAVDDSIHFFSKYLESIKERSFEETIDYIVHHSGNAMILTTVLLSFTFAIFAVSSFIPNINFAIVTVTALNIALLCDLLVLPALLSLRK